MNTSTKKIGALTVVRNAEKYIVPHLKMFEGVTKNVVLFINQPIYDWTQHYPEEADNTLEIVRTQFPEVEIYETSTNHYGAPILNEGLSYFTDCDYVIHLHADVILSKTDYKKLIDFIQESSADVIKANMKECWINYYNDFSHGVKNCEDIEPIVCTAQNRYSQYWESSGSKEIINSITGHHFNGWKGVTGTKEWMENKVQTETGVYLKDLEEKYGFLECPEEIKEMFT